MNATDFENQTTCRLCHAAELELTLPMRPSPVADGYAPTAAAARALPAYPMGVHRCRNCGHLQLEAFVAPSILYSDFKYFTGVSHGLQQHFQRYAAEVTARLGLAPGDSVFDIGSNDGTLLGYFHQHGLDVMGIDPARDAVAAANSRGINTLHAYLDASTAGQLLARKGPARLVCSNNTMANIPDLEGFVAAIHSLLADDGVFVFETIYAPDMIAGGAFDNIYHEHIYYFSIRPLHRFLARLGLELIHVELVGTKGGSFRGYAQKIGAARPVDPSVERFCAAEEKSGFHRGIACAELMARIDTARSRTIAFLDESARAGKTVWGYCASHSVTTVLHEFGIGHRLPVLLDDNERKHGTFSPGFGIPVLPSSELHVGKPDYVLVLAWRFLEPILQRHAGFMNTGGRFVTPMPEFRVIDPAS